MKRKKEYFYKKIDNMFKHRDYNDESRLEKVWYDSSNIVYSECEDKLNDYKTLRIVFKNGATYEYSNVDVNDYLMFVRGGLDGSNGKAFAKFIKPKYQCERLSNTDLLDLEQELKSAKEKKKEKELKEKEVKKEDE